MPALEMERSPTSNFEQAIERQIIQKTWGRVYRLQVTLRDDRLIVRGRTATYYAKQLALEAALEALGSTVTVPVDLDIQVGIPPTNSRPVAEWSTIRSHSSLNA